MSLFKKSDKTNEPEQETKKFEQETKKPEQPKEEWIWVEGYKGTKKDMTCKGFQYEIGKQYDIDGDINECSNGFHLCKDLSDVFKYYEIGKGHRFFKVKALVRKKDFDSYGMREWYYEAYLNHRHLLPPKDKLVAKSIVLVSELQRDEIFCCSEAQDFPDKYKNMAIDIGVNKAKRIYHIDTLKEDGYSECFAVWLEDHDKFDTAHAVGTQKDLSTDMKVLFIMKQ